MILGGSCFATSPNQEQVRHKIISCHILYYVDVTLDVNATKATMQEDRIFMSQDSFAAGVLKIKFVQQTQGFLCHLKAGNMSHYSAIKHKMVMYNVQCTMTQSIMQYLYMIIYIYISNLSAWTCATCLQRDNSAKRPSSPKFLHSHLHRWDNSNLASSIARLPACTAKRTTWAERCMWRNLGHTFEAKHSLIVWSGEKKVTKLLMNPSLDRKNDEETNER